MAQHHPLGDIEYLRENLLNSYKLGFPILKELVQNAEDARATHLDYGWIEGLASADHPLLRSPALFMLDNGDFTEDNAKAIRYILGGSSKPNQQDSIGKFGLGLKSVFHLCEAFFYIAPSIANSKYKTFGLFNPWAGAENKDDYHENWDDFSIQDISYIKDAVKQILDTDIYQEKWFILWIPLRQEWHKTNDKEEDGIELGCIKNGQDDFFTTKVPDFLGNEDTQQQLSLLLPLLSTIKEIRYWDKSFEKPKFQIKLKGIQRHNKFSEILINKTHDIKGKISINNKNVVNFYGFETIIDSPELINIQNSPELPTKFKYIQPHSAIIFNQSKNIFAEDKSKLFLRTAVFLPINEDWESKNKTNKFYYNITLHGYFFVDFARTGILGWDKDKWVIHPQKSKDDDSTACLKKQWNFHLYKGLLSQVLHCLDHAIIDLKLSSNEVQEIIKVLADSALFKDKNSDYIYQKYQYVYCVHPKQDQTGWRLLEKNQKVLSLPDIPPSWDIFLHLKNLVESETNKCYLTLSNKINLFPKNKPDQWNAEDILAILDLLNHEILFIKNEHINYLKSFLEKTTKNKLSAKIEDKAIELLKKGLSMGMAKKLKPNVQRLISLIDKNKLFVIDCDQDILQSIYKLDLEVLVIHKSFNPEQKQDQNSNELDSADDAISIIECLTNMLKQEDNQQKQTQVYKLIKFVLKSANEHLKTIFDKCSNLPIEGENLKTSQSKFYCLSEIKASNFFAKSGDNKLAKFLQKALANQKIILIDKEMIDIFKQQITIENSNSCLKLLSPNAQLSKPEKRINLLKELLKNA